MTGPAPDAIDHFVLTVASIDETADFYVRALGMRVESFRAADGTARVALRFGVQKINLHEAGREFEPKARVPTPGSADFCLLTSAPLSDWAKRLDDLGVPILEGPVPRSGAEGPITSIYLRDPDGNLVEIARRDTG
jgi:catechol 2,3-dioxygenase-like lactoylglutathione lyase family enzyme